MGKKLCPRSWVQPEGVTTTKARAQFFSYTDRCKPVDIYFLFTGSLFFFGGGGGRKTDRGPLCTKLDQLRALNYPITSGPLRCLKLRNICAFATCWY